MTTPPPDIPPSTPAFREDQLSQIPALHLLQNLGYQYLLPAEALRLRGGRESHVLLVDVLTEQLRRLNRVRHGGQELPFNESAIAEAVRQLRDADAGGGLLHTNRGIWELLRFGISAPQMISGDTRSFPLRYIDWDHPENNVFHVTDEFAVTRAGRDDTYRPDVVLFVNGIPFVVIECKRPSLRDALGEALSQQVRNQKEDGIPQLYHYAQLLLAVAMNAASYGATNTGAKFYARWQERGGNEAALSAAVSRPLTRGQLDEFFALDPLRFHGLYPAAVREWFEATQNQGRQVTEQDRLLHALCRPERLLEPGRPLHGVRRRGAQGGALSAVLLCAGRDGAPAHARSRRHAQGRRGVAHAGQWQEHHHGHAGGRYCSRTGHRGRPDRAGDRPRGPGRADLPHVP